MSLLESHSGESSFGGFEDPPVGEAGLSSPPPSGHTSSLDPGASAPVPPLGLSVGYEPSPYSSDCMMVDVKPPTTALRSSFEGLAGVVRREVAAEIRNAEKRRRHH